MSRPDFVHLHVHSEYSLLDGANRISDMVAACREDGQTALALTDHGNMFGAVELFQKCVDGGIQPLIGCEVYIAKQSMHEPHSKRKGNGYSHLTLIARNEEGYKNLARLASEAYVNGLHFRPRIDLPLLEQYASGISCLSGCLAGEINQLFLRDKDQEAEDFASKLRDLFGPEHFWLELQRNGLELQDKVNESLWRLHQRTRIPIVATNDIHYLRQEDCHAQDVLLCINTGAKRADEKRFRFETDTLFFKTREEMADMFRDMPEAVAATMDVASQVDFAFEFGQYKVPQFEPDTGEDQDTLFDRLLEENLVRLYGAESTAARERLEHEKGVIRDLGFVAYFLIVWDLIRWARENGIRVGPGRGSAAGSIVAYLLDITRLDPLEHGLLFERFLNSSRVSMPDIDIDFCKEGRERVIEYTRQRYGEQNVTQIVTFGTMASRTVVRDVGRVLAVPLREVDRIAKKIPSGPGAPTLAKALETDSDLAEIRQQSPEVAEVFDLSIPLEGLARHISTHAAGVVITPRPTWEYVPLAKNGDDVTTQYPAPQLELLGLLKMDYLGLRTLTILERALANVVKKGGQAPDLENLPPGDPATYRLLAAGDTLGVFQLESEGMRKLLARLKPDCFEDLVAVLALYRPGPLESGMVDSFVRRKHGEEAIEYPHEALREILEETYGTIVYQEQVMLTSVALGGFSLNDADNLRKAMGKKKPEIMQAFSAQFIEGATSRGCSKDVAEQVWENVVKFGGYGFNKSHSAAYALITYQTAYMKANYRTAFLAANLSCEMSNSDTVKAFVEDARHSNIEVLPPDVRHSCWEFEPEGNAIRFGMGAIKGTGHKAIEALESARAELLQEDKSLGLHLLASSVDPSEVGRTTWEAMIKAGAFDWSGLDRGVVLHELEGALADGARAAADRRAGQGSLFGVAEESPAPGAPDPQSAGDPPDSAHVLTEQERLRAEFEVLGFYLTGHPLEERAGLVSLLSSAPTTELAQRIGAGEVRIAGLVTGLSENLVKSGRLAGQKMARFRIEDLSGSVGVVCFPRTWEECRDKIEDGAILVLTGKLEEDRDEPGILCDSVATLSDALTRFVGALSLSIEPDHRDLLPRIKGTLAKHRGARPVYLMVTGNDGVSRRVRAGGELGVTISEELAEDLVGLLGKERVGLVKVG